MKLDRKKLLTALLTLAFAALMTAMVLQQVPEDSDLAARAGTFRDFMCCMMAVFLAAAVWELFTGADMMSLLSAVSILISVGSCYHFAFSDYAKYCRTIWLMLAAAVAAYQIWRRMNILSDGWFLGVSLLILGLLAANVLFGKEQNGAKLAIVVGSVSIHPGEYVRVLLVVLGASSLWNWKRSLIYCGLCLLSCGVLVLDVNDLGAAVLIFATFLLLTYILYDSPRLSGTIILAAVIVFLIAIRMAPHAYIRIKGWFHAMDADAASTQQRDYLIAVICGGIRGLGLEHAHLMTDAYAAAHDGALAGVLAIYGLPMLVVTVAAYGVIAAIPMHNASIHSSGFLSQIQITMLVSCQVILNMAGALDALPYTGLVAPIISEGMNAGLCFGVLLGISGANMNPKLKRGGSILHERRKK